MSNETDLSFLLVDKVLEGETAEAFADEDIFNDDERLSMELTTARIALHNLPLNESLPVSLQSKVIAQAEQFFADCETSRATEKPSLRLISGRAESSVTTERESVSSDRKVLTAPRRSGFWQWSGWAVAAGLAVAFGFYANRPPQTVYIDRPVEPTQISQNIKPLAEQRNELIAEAKDLVRLPIASPDKKSAVGGDIVWSNSLQKGFIRFTDLPKNTPSQDSYQTWIFDTNQSEKTPVNGGVFNVSSDGEVIIPITAELQVIEPKAFAITKEKFGGVVVSDRQKVVALGKTPV